MIFVSVSIKLLVLLCFTLHGSLYRALLYYYEFVCTRFLISSHEACLQAAISQSRKLASRNATKKETQAEIGAASSRPGPLSVILPDLRLFAWIISHQPAVLFSQNKPASSNQPAVFFFQNKSAPAISHQPNEQAVILGRMRPNRDAGLCVY
jgi:hypothetical protein